MAETKDIACSVDRPSQLESAFTSLATTKKRTGISVQPPKIKGIGWVEVAPGPHEQDTSQILLRTDSVIDRTIL